MKTFEVEITFNNGKSQTERTESNDNITALNLALNRLNTIDRTNVINVNLNCID